MTVPDRLSRRAANRATLARQLLLDRARLPVRRAPERLVGLQAQLPGPAMTARTRDDLPVPTMTVWTPR